MGTTKEESINDVTEVVRQWIELIWHAGNFDQIDRFHPPIFDNEGQPSTSAEARAWHEEMRATFPDLHYQIEDLIVANDRVIVRWRARCT